VGSILLSGLSAVVTLFFALAVFQRWSTHRTAHLLVWGIGLVFYGLGNVTEAAYSLLGWSDVGYRLWYLCGAILTAAWLGQGTVYLLVRRRIGRIRLASLLMVGLLVLSLWGAYLIFTLPLDPSKVVPGPLTGKAIVTPANPLYNVRLLTPIFNVYGVVALIGGAIYSAFLFWRKRIMPNRVLGNIFIAAGAMSPALGGTLSKLSLAEVLYLSELIGSILMFTGFILATSRAAEPVTAAEAQRP